jgi:hypothetical protein
VNQRRRTRIASVCLVLATFFNPFGFDILFAMIMSWTNSYWYTIVIFYSLSALFFGFYFFLSGNKKLKSKEKVKEI